MKQTTSTTDRLGMSNRQTAEMLASVVKAGGGDVAKFKMYKSGVQRQRCLNVESMCMSYM